MKRAVRAGQGGLVAAAAVALVCASSGQAQPSAHARAAQQHPSTVKGVDLYNQATRHVEQTVPACSMQRMVPKPHTSFSNGRPERAVLDVLGVLRRKPTAAELRLGGTRSPFPEGPMTRYRRFVRIVHGPQGSTAHITVERGHMSVPAIETAACQRRVGVVLDRLVQGKPAAVRRAALGFHRHFRLGPQATRNLTWVMFDAEGGGTGGPLDPKRFHKQGMMIEGGGIVPPPPGFNFRDPQAVKKLRHHYEVAGLVPDGVATVTIEIAAGKRAPFPSGDPKRAHAYRTTEHVRENVFYFRLREDPIGAKMRLVWRNHAGRVIRVLPDHGD